MGFVHLRHILIVLKGLLDGRSLSVRYLLNLTKMLQIHLLSHLLVDDAVSGHLYNIKVIDIFILLLNKVYSDAFPYVSLFEGHMEPQPSSSHSHNPLSPPLFINSSQPILFDWQHRWLKGHQYAHMLRNVSSYCQKFGIKSYPPKTHPSQIYQQPENGLLYFVEGKGLGSEFGFPRVQGKKKFRWKKMNFTTDLPKKNPMVTYIVASTTHTHTQQIDDSQERLFRMHAVIPYQKEGQQPPTHILCHILEIKRKKEVQSIEHCLKETKVDYYKLFAFLHNACTNK